MNDIKELVYIYKQLIKYKEFQYISTLIRDRIITLRVIRAKEKDNCWQLFSYATFQFDIYSKFEITYEALKLIINEYGIKTLFKIFIACKNIGHDYRIVHFGVYDYYNNRIYPLLNFINTYGR